MSENLEVRVTDGSFSCHVERPGTPGPHPVVIVLQEIFGVNESIRSIARIIVLHMSAQFMHAGAQSIICVEHTVHACSQAEQASIQACMSDMSMVLMPAIDMSLDIMSIIIESTSHSSGLFAAARAA